MKSICSVKKKRSQSSIMSTSSQAEPGYFHSNRSKNYSIKSQNDNITTSAGWARGPGKQKWMPRLLTLRACTRACACVQIFSAWVSKGSRTPASVLMGCRDRAACGCVRVFCMEKKIIRVWYNLWTLDNHPQSSRHNVMVSLLKLVGPTLLCLWANCSKCTIIYVFVCICDLFGPLMGRYSWWLLV